MILPLVGLTFWDHSMDNAVDLAPIKCQIVGWLFKEDDLSYYVASWVCDNKINDRNTEAYQVLKSTVVEHYQLTHKLVSSFSFKREKR